MKYFIVAILFSINIFSQSVNSGKQLLSLMQKKFETVNDLQAEFVQTINGKQYLKGKIKFKKENYLKIDTDKLLIVTDEKTSWSYNKKQNKVIISDYDEEKNEVFSINEIVYNYPNECDLFTEQINGETVLVMIPNTYTFNFDTLKIWLDNDYLIKKITIDEPSSGVIEIIFANYVLNSGISNSEFVFDPPKGCKIIDLR